MAMVERRYVTVSQYAKRANLTAQAVRMACANGRIQGAFQPYAGGHWRIPREAMEALPTRFDVMPVKRRG